MILNLLAVETTAAETTSEAEAAVEAALAEGDVVQAQLTTVTEGLNDTGKFLTDVWNGFLTKLPTIGIAIVILIIGILLSKLVVKLMGKALDRSKLDLTVNHFLKSIVRIILYVLVITVVLTLLGIPTTSIITVIGTAGVAVGLALQNSLSNIAGGFLILFAKPFKAGDYISTNGHEGFVRSINILYTKLETFTNVTIYVPNGIAANAVCQNYSEHEFRRVDHLIPVSYNVKFDDAKKSIEEVIAKIPTVITDNPTMAPAVLLEQFGDSSINIRVRLWCKNENYWGVYFDSLRLIREQFIADNIEIPFNQLDVHIKDKA